MNDIRSLIPRDKFDMERTEAAVAAGYPAVAPILPELFEWVQDANWPIADTLARFLANVGDPVIVHIRRIFKTDDSDWKYNIISNVVSRSPHLITALRPDIEELAQAPADNEDAQALKERALQFIETHTIS